MKKKILGMFVCMLMIIPIYIFSCSGKEIVYVHGHGYEGYESKYPSIWQRPFSAFLKSNESGNYVSVSYSYSAAPIFLLVNGIPQFIFEPATVTLGLTEPNTFALLIFYRLVRPNPLWRFMDGRIFSICDSLEIIGY